MRKIKFRAWIQADPYDESDPPKMEMCYHLAFEDYEPVNDLLGAVEHLMQFTGLKDNHMQDVYEGDILYVSSKRSRYVVEWVNEAARYILRPVLNTATQPRISKITGEGRVIGNIYDNPELLKEEE